MSDAKDVARALAELGETIEAVATAIGVHVIDDDRVTCGYELTRVDRTTFVYVSPRASDLDVALGLAAAVNRDGQFGHGAGWREALAEELVAILSGDATSCARMEQA